MKQNLLFAFIASVLVSCGNSDQPAEAQTGNTGTAPTTQVNDSTNAPTIEWIGGTFQDLGKVVDGQVVEVTYRFRNTGKTNLVIEDVTAGCGCTVPEKPAKPFAPGEEGEIKAKFDSRGRKGPNDKYVTVKANTQPNKDHVLTFKVTVTE